MNASGETGQWLPAEALPNGAFAVRTFAVFQRVYALAGDIRSPLSKTLYSAAIMPDGTLQAWEKVGDLPIALTQASVRVSSHVVYLVGKTQGENAAYVTLRAYLFADGSLGPWMEHPGTPEAVDEQFGETEKNART